MTTWQCVKQCGACCHLDPAERPDLMSTYYQMNWSCILVWWRKDGVLITTTPTENARFIQTASLLSSGTVGFEDMYGIQPDVERFCN